MTAIRDRESYEGLPQVYLLTSDYKFISLGFYDPEWVRDTELSYQPGKFSKQDGTPYDSAYNDKQPMILSFKDLLFGNHRWAQYLGGHMHNKYIVSTSLIRPHDVRRVETNTGDILLFADLSRSPPKTEERRNHTQETLYEITPHLSPEELARLPKDIRFITKIKERLHELDSENWKMKGELVHERSIAIASTAALFAAQERLHQLVLEYQNIYDQVITLTLSTRTTIKKGIEKHEAEHFLGIPWETYTRADLDEVSKNLQAQVRAVAAEAQLNGKLSDAQKYQLTMQTANVVGLDYMRKVLLGLEEYKYSTSTGMQTLTISKEPTPQELFIKNCELLFSGQISPEDFNERGKRSLNNITERYKRHENPLAATQELKGELLKKIAPEMQVQHATAR